MLVFPQSYLVVIPNQAEISSISPLSRGRSCFFVLKQTVSLSGRLSRCPKFICDTSLSTSRSPAPPLRCDTARLDVSHRLFDRSQKEKPPPFFSRTLIVQLLYLPNGRYFCWTPASCDLSVRVFSCVPSLSLSFLDRRCYLLFYRGKFLRISSRMIQSKLRVPSKRLR